MTQPWQMTATDLAAAIRRRDTSAREATQSVLDRLDAVNPRINAVVDHRPEEALARADAIDAALALGEDPGPLAGVPVTVKINVDQAGFATSNGLVGQRDLVATENNPVVDNLLRAGAVIVGRTNTPAFSYRWFTDNRLHGRTRNPRSPGRTPGGSSGGAAAAVAAGIGPIGHGTDIAGSVRYPAYACGIHGLRPTPGRVAAWNPGLPERPLGPQITAVSGPLARSIADIRLALHAMAAPDPRDPWWTPAPLTGPDRPRRAAIAARPDGMDTSPEIAAAVEDAGQRLRRAGWEVVDAPALPPMAEMAEAQLRLWLGDGYDGMLAAAEREGDPGALHVLKGFAHWAQAMTLADYSAILTRRATVVRQWQVFLEHTPVVVMPVSAVLPLPDDADLHDLHGTWAAQMPQVALPLLGLPGLSVATSTVDGVATGVQVVAGRFREDLCLLAGEAIEAGGVPPMPVDPA